MAGCADPVVRESDLPLFGRSARVTAHAPTERGAERCLESVRDNARAAAEALGAEGELARLNRAAGDGYHVVESFDLYRALLLALDYARASGGAYDPTVGPLLSLHDRPGGRPPTEAEIAATLDRVGWDGLVVAGESQAVHFRKPGMRLVLDDLAEAFALDAASRGFALGCQGGQLRFGDTLYLWGAPNDAASWSVAIPDPRREGATLATLAMNSRGVAAIGLPPEDAGAYFDARTGRRVSSDVTVAVAIGDTAADATLLARSLYALGSRAGGEFLERTQRVEALLLVEGNGPTYLLASTSLSGRLELDPALEAEVEGRVRYLLPPAEADWR